MEKQASVVVNIFCRRSEKLGFFPFCSRNFCIFVETYLNVRFKYREWIGVFFHSNIRKAKVEPGNKVYLFSTISCFKSLLNSGAINGSWKGRLVGVLVLGQWKGSMSSGR